MKIKLKGAYARAIPPEAETATPHPPLHASTSTVHSPELRPPSPSKSVVNLDSAGTVLNDVRNAGNNGQGQANVHQGDEDDPNGLSNGQNGRDEDDDEEYAESSSSHSDNEFISAPLPLNDSSGDEYHAPRGGRGPGRPRSNHRTSSRRESTRSSRRDGSESLEPVEVGPSTRQRISLTMKGRPLRASRRDETTPLQASGTDEGDDSLREDDEQDGDSVQNVGQYSRVVESEDEEDGMDVDDDSQQDEETTSVLHVHASATASGGPHKRPQQLGQDAQRRGSMGVMAKQRAIKNGQYGFDGDELMLPTDPAGEAKVDRLGQLQGGREYKAPTFTFPTRPEKERLYMLAIDAARCAGFRDSLYFFRRNPWIHKLTCTNEEKEILVNRGKLHVNLKTRQVTVVTARNCFKVFGARFIKGGKYVVDDYYESAAIAKGLKAEAPAWSEAYNPEIDNTTLAMPKVGNFAQKLGPGRPAYMKIGKAMDMAGATRLSAAPDDDDDMNNLTAEERKKREDAADALAIAEEETRVALAQKKGLHSLLGLPAGYSPAQFGLVPAQGGAGIGLGPGIQFGSNGQAPFNEQWEKSKARKPAPHMNGRNWMWFWAKAVIETNKAVMSVRKEYSAYHRITLGANSAAALEEEDAGVWPVSESEDEYETLDEYYARQGVPSANSKAKSLESDDRRRGRTPDPSPLALPTPLDPNVKAEADGDAAETSAMHADGTHKKKRRRRSPLRGFYDQHTRAPIVRTDSQPLGVLSCERVAGLPEISLDVASITQKAPDAVTISKLAAVRGMATVEYIVQHT